jgi:peroxiredoxin
VFAAGVAGFYVLFVYWYVPAAFPPPDLTNRPGTLISLGQTTPDVAFTTVDGGAVHLGDLRGRVVLLNFFATWCGPCRMELPELQEIWNEYRSHDDFEMFVIGREESAETVRAFNDEHGFTFPMASDPDRSAYSHFATESIPRTYVISRDGKIVYEVTGYYPGEIATLKNVLNQEVGARK